MVNSNTIEEIKRLNKEVKQMVKENKVVFSGDFNYEMIKHNIKIEINKILLDGLHLEDKHLYPTNPDKKHTGKNYYCIYKDKEFLFPLIEVTYILTSYFKKNSHIEFFHISHLKSSSKEQRRYKELKKNL